MSELSRDFHPCRFESANKWTRTKAPILLKQSKLASLFWLSNTFKEASRSHWRGFSALVELVAR